MEMQEQPREFVGLLPCFEAALDVDQDRSPELMPARRAITCCGDILGSLPMLSLRTLELTKSATRWFHAHHRICANERLSSQHGRRPLNAPCRACQPPHHASERFIHQRRQAPLQSLRGFVEDRSSMARPFTLYWAHTSAEQSARCCCDETPRHCGQEEEGFESG